MIRELKWLLHTCTAPESPIAELIEAAAIELLAMRLIEPTLTRHGYNVKGLAEEFSAKPAEIRLLFRGQLDPLRTRELHEQMLAAGLPI